MTAPPSRSGATCINHLRRGTTYCATTRRGTATGVYLGIEVPHGDRSILLGHDAGTHSIAVDDLVAIGRA
jgi:hypothetical protein